MRIVSMLAVAVIAAMSISFAGAPKKADNFTLNDYNGTSVSLSDYKNSKAIVLMFVATECPVSNAYNERYAKLYDDYKGKNVAVIGINSNKEEPANDVKEHAKENNLSFPILKDINNVIADKFDAQRTPEVYVLHPTTLEVLYHGRIDDSQRIANITSHDLRAALDEILAGKAVSTKETKAFGCSIKRVQK
jgi:peroxiredoxin